jgi:ATP-binding cassette, subfamily B (MDR/TAP), member 1
MPDNVQFISFSTKFELFLDFIGLVCAAAAGSGQVSRFSNYSFAFFFTTVQPLMTLLFGNIIQAFVNFGVALNNAKQGVPGAAEQLPAAAASVRHAATLNAIYFVYIGKPPVSTANLSDFSEASEFLSAPTFICGHGPIRAK